MTGREPSSAEPVSGTALIYERVQRAGRIFDRDPEPGDLVFFDNTWDRDGDGALDDKFTHVGLVDHILSDGTIEILHLGNAGIGYLRMNLSHRDEAIDPGTGAVLNDALRRRSPRDPVDTPYLSGQLFHAFGRIDFGGP